jgi:ABC-type glycerol-3-phosphate transport system substrate-binding protein
MEFVLSDEGQRLWNYQAGTQGGPVADSLRRLPVRKDFYTEDHLRWMTDRNQRPFEDAKEFTYHPEWTGSLFNVIRFLVKVMCVDFYGRSFEEQCRRSDGSTRVGFNSPRGGATVSVDAMAMLRGAPQPEAATEFMEFVLSDEGQRLWNYQAGSKGGPVADSLRRLPVRKDFYTDDHLRWMTDRDQRPFEDAKEFTYHPEWTASLFNVIRFLVKVMCVDVHNEQQKAWRMLSHNDFPKRGAIVFGDVSLANYAAAQKLAGDLARKDKELEVKMAREMSSYFRSQYDRAYDLARRGQ